ncbi:MAG: sensor histidine kinase [Rhodocyclaceae bacterium]|nr:sensor histidine kinase [Rhodocyclaceae bacterium]MDZ4216282.1 sensor histidine kinase [Rhodocyclaceae bacterium]
MTSLRLRLLLGTLCWIAASILVAGWGLGKLFQQHVATQFHAELQTHLDQLTAQLALNEQGQPMLVLPPSDPRLNKPFAGLYWQIDRRASADFPAAAAVLRSRSLWDQILTVPADTPATGELHQHRTSGPEGKMLRLIERHVEIDALPLRLIVAADESLMIEPVARFNGELWLALGILGFGLALAALVQVLVGLAPLRSLHAALGRVRDGATQQLEGGFPTEIMPLVTEFNSVLTQNAEVVERARTQAGNLAHALKTPLSVLANAADAAKNKDEDLARLVATQVEMARKQVDYHLARAQAAATVRLPGARTPLQPVIKGLVRTMRRIHAGRNLALIVQPFATPVAFRGEEHDLQEMLGNLIDNACKWATSRIEIRAHVEQDRLRVSVDDDGKGVATEQRETILRRGVRADEQVPGTGLGLAIVDDLAHMYGGQLALTDSPLGGLQATLTLPATR